MLLLDARVRDSLHPALKACATGAVPINTGLLHLLIEAASPDEAKDALIAASLVADAPHAKARLDAARRLLLENPQAFAVVKSVLRDVEHAGMAPDVESGVAHWADMFGRVVRIAPEGAVALYALGNPVLLQAATDEVVAYLRKGGMIGPRTRVLEIGCGIGRFVKALAPEVAEVTGLDIAPAMIEEARRRCDGLTHIRLQVSSGRDLAPIPDGSADLILAADVFPYLMQAGLALAEDHVREGARVLAPGGSLAILNLSYRDDPVQDEEDVRRLAVRHGLAVAVAGERPFSLWDGTVFRLIKPI